MPEQQSLAYQQLKNALKAYLPVSLHEPLRLTTRVLRHAQAIVEATIVLPRYRLIGLRARINHLAHVARRPEPSATICRVFQYNKDLLPNEHVASIERSATDIESARQSTGLSIGYPAWNLLYYSLLCSLTSDIPDVVIVETGTNRGFSTAFLAQALKDSGRPGTLHTVDIDQAATDAARKTIKEAGLDDYVVFHTGDSVTFLRDFVSHVPYINFAFLDGSHEYRDVITEFRTIYPKVAAVKGKVYFDNTTAGGVAYALRYIHHAYGGNLIEFANCSWFPPGNVLWQP